MSSVVVIKLKHQEHISSDELNWDDVKQRKLEDYIRMLIDDKSSPDRQMYNIDWDQLSRHLKVNDKKLIQQKADEIYESEYISKYDKISGTVYQAKSYKESKYYEEIQELISDLNLKDFVTGLETKGLEGSSGYSKNYIVTSDQFYATGKPSVSENGYKNMGGNIKKLSTSIVRNGTQEAPEIKPISMNQLPFETLKINRKASIETSNVNVVTKPLSESIFSRKSEGHHIKDGIANVSRKIRLSVSNKNHNLQEITEIPSNVSEQKPLKIEGKNRAQINQSLKATRRRSLVGDNLPTYIKDQLKNASLTLVPVERKLKESTANEILPSVKYPETHSEDKLNDSQSKDTRNIKNNCLKNKISDSEYLYSNMNSSNSNYAKVELEQSSRSNSIVNIERIRSEAQRENMIEGEIEYISPSSFTKFFESITHADNDQASKEYDSNVDFASLGNTDEHSEMFDDGQSDYDSYLFKI